MHPVIRLILAILCGSFVFLMVAVAFGGMAAAFGATGPALIGPFALAVLSGVSTVFIIAE